MSNNSEHVGKQNIIIRALTWMNINSCIYLFISHYKVYKKIKSSGVYRLLFHGFLTRHCHGRYVNLSFMNGSENSTHKDGDGDPYQTFLQLYIGA